MKICIFLANNLEEGEAINTIDVIRRADLTIDAISIYKDNLEINGSHNIKLIADKKINDINDYNKEYDCFIIPGGKAVNDLINNNDVKNIIVNARKANKIIAAICAAPLLLLKWNILNGEKITHYPNALNYANVDHNSATIVDKKIITGASIGTSIQFALTIIEAILGKVKKDNIKKTLVIR